MEQYSRRQVVRLGVLGATGVAAGCSGERIPPEDPILAQDCDAVPQGCDRTGDDIEGPFWIEGVPIRSNLDQAGDEGVALRLVGLVVAAGSCQPLAGAVVEIWHANPRGAYDNTDSHDYRGQVEVDADGRYAFTTLLPGRYRNGGQLRPAHIHLKVHLDGAEKLTTQLYFDDDPYLADDPWATPERTVCLVEDGGGRLATFDLAIG